MSVRTDDLTKLPLRGAFMEAAAASVETARAAGAPGSLLVLDVDLFKLINDTFGHLQGDDVLVQVAELLRRNLRGYDIAARYAGDEFVALLPNTPLAGAREVAERICAATRGHVFDARNGGAAVPVTVSVGVAAFPEHGSTVEAVFAAADRALYQVKRNGRDGVATASAPGDEPAHLPLGIERFVGRGPELRTLVALLEDAVGGRPRVVAVTGEAGVGKTTLLRQLEPEVRLRSGSLVTGRSQEADVRPPYAAWADVISALRRLGTAPPARPWRELPRLVPALAEDGVATPAGPVGTGGKYLLLEEIAEYLRLAAQMRPLVIVLDDMQWADAASWDALEYLVPQLESERILFCLTLRTEELRGDALERRRRISRAEAFHELTLERLTREELQQWAEAAFHRQDVGREFLSFLHHHTEGNPLFVVQLLRTLLDEGAIWHDGERWAWHPVSELRLPVAVTDVVSRRLARLSDSAREVLTVAAAIGREFDVELAVDVGAGTEAQLHAAVDEAIAAGIVHQAARASDSYTFSHALLAEVLRDAMTPRRRRTVHERIARALERTTPGAAPEIAVHADRGGDAATAYRHALAAADQARLVYAHYECAGFLALAERNASSPSELAEVRARLADLAEASGRYADAEELLDLAISWFDARDDRHRALTLRRARERVRILLGRPAQATLESCRALDEEATELNAASERAALLMMISQAHDRLGDHAAAERSAWDAVYVAGTAGEPTLRGDALNRLGITLERHQPEQAARVYRQALELYQRTGDARGQANCHNNLGIVLALRWDWGLAREELTTAIALGRTTGTPDLWGLYLLNLGVVHLRVGGYDRAKDLFGEALALFAAVRNSERQLYALLNLAHLDRERGELEPAAELYDAALALARRIGHADGEAVALGGAGLARLGRGDEAAARRALIEADERVGARDAWFQGRELVEALAAHVLVAAGDAAGALERFTTARARADETDVYAALWLAVACAAVLRPHAAATMAQLLAGYDGRVRELGNPELRRRYDALA